ncbi:hypothetical protein R1flu_004529 [Riccia fluitans]|uniref:Phosphate transporter PHO1 n=1 Tax=Riccia fluitans TaxID=41844 RepID=A0ABD1YQJ4_9MARC
MLLLRVNHGGLEPEVTEDTLPYQRNFPALARSPRETRKGFGAANLESEDGTDDERGFQRMMNKQRSSFFLQRSSGGSLLRRGYSLQQRTAASETPTFIKVNHKSHNYFGIKIDTVETEILIPGYQASNDVIFFARLDHELQKVNEFYLVKEMEFQKHAEILDMQMRTLFELKIEEERKGYNKPKPPLPSWVSDSEFDLTTPITRRRIFNRQRSIQVMDAVVSQHNEVLFKTILNHNGMTNAIEDPKEQLSDIDEVEKWSSPDYILNNAADEVEDPRLWRSQPSVRSRKRHKLVDQALPELRTDEPRLETSRAAGTILEGEEGSSVQVRIQDSETMLRDAFIEFYRGLTLLKGYRQLNRQAFNKILKKYDKATDRDVKKIYLKEVETSYFNSSEKVSFLLNWVESMFADFFMEGDRDKARNCLKPRTNKSPHGITFFLGLFTGCSIALVVAYAAVLHVETANLTPEQQKSRFMIYMSSVFPVFSMTALVLLHMYLYGLNVFFWTRTRINYSFIFEFAPGTELDYRKVLLVTTGLTALFLMGIVGHLTATLYESPYTDFIPLVLLLILVLIVFFPFRYIYRSSRFFFLKTLLRLVTAPFYKVKLADFFLGDQLCSQVPVLRNIEYAMCYFIGGWFLTADGDKCTNNQNYLLGYYLISVLPYWWRLMQCLRRNVDEGGLMHLANAGKYLSAMIAVITKIFYGRQASTVRLIAYILSSTIATVYQAYWDIVIDWGLLDLKSHNRWLRDKLILEDKNYVYYISMVSNIIFRLAWVLSITRFQFGGLDPHFTDFILAALEIIRRGNWNFYRLENEHLNNVGQYRATKSVPLPFEHKYSM